MKKILVLGGTGAMGEHLVSILAQRRDKVVVTTRAERPSSPDIEYVEGDAQDDTFLRHILAQEWDAIIDFMVYTTNKFEHRAAALLASTKQYIYLSSARVYADSSIPIKEEFQRLLESSCDTKFLETDEYALAKARQEDILSKSGYVNWTIIRPYITYSEKRLQLGVLEKEAWLYRALNERTIVFSEEIAGKITTLTYGFDVARTIAALIGEDKALGQVYHVTHPQAAMWSRILDMYLDVLEKHLGSRPKVLLLERTQFFECQRSEYQIKYDRLFNRRFDNSKISEFVDINNFKPVEEGLVRCLEQFLESPRFDRIDWRLEALKDRFTGDSTSISSIAGFKNKVKYLIYRYIGWKKAYL